MPSQPRRWRTASTANVARDGSARQQGYATALAESGQAGGAADLELHAVGIAEEQGPLAAEALDLADLGAGVDQPLAEPLERGQRVDGEGEVVDRTAAAHRATVTEDRVGGDLEGVEGGTTAQRDDRHPRVVALGLHLEGHLATEGVGVELLQPIEIGGDGGDVVEAGGDRHEEDDATAQKACWITSMVRAGDGDDVEADVDAADPG